MIFDNKCKYKAFFVYSNYIFLYFNSLNFLKASILNFFKGVELEASIKIYVPIYIWYLVQPVCVSYLSKKIIPIIKKFLASIYFYFPVVGAESRSFVCLKFSWPTIKHWEEGSMPRYHKCTFVQLSSFYRS